MAEDEFELISMADIARLAGESRATVGNWKSRNPDDFPPERGRSPRGPMYDRAETMRWLEGKGRLDARPREVLAVWHLLDGLRGELDVEDATALILVLLAMRVENAASAWGRLRTTAPSELDDALRSVVHADAQSDPDLLPRAPVPARVLAEVVTTLDSLNPADTPAMADALLERAAKTMGHRGGEYLSPPSVRRLIIGIADPTGIVYNPACGIGQLLIDAAQAAGPQASRLVAQEVNQRVWSMAKANLLLHDVAAEVELGNVFTEDRFPGLRADRVIAIPPWNQRLRELRFLDDARWTWGEPGERDGNSAWIQHCLYHLADDGRAVLAMPNGVLFEGARGGRIRQRIIRAGLLDAVISLPGGSFQWTGIQCSLLVFVKGRPTINGKPAPTLMVDLTGDGPQVAGSRQAALDGATVDEAIALYQTWVAGGDPTDSRAAVAAFDTLVDNDYVIDPGRYLARAELPSVGDLTAKRSTLIDELGNLMFSSKRADDELRSLLERDR